MVGPARVELATSRLSGVRSNHLSYEPFAGMGPPCGMLDLTRGGSKRETFLRAGGANVKWFAVGRTTFALEGAFASVYNG